MYAIGRLVAMYQIFSQLRRALRSDRRDPHTPLADHGSARRGKTRRVSLVAARQEPYVAHPARVKP